MCLSRKPAGWLAYSHRGSCILTSSHAVVPGTCLSYNVDDGACLESAALRRGTVRPTWWRCPDRYQHINNMTPYAALFTPSCNYVQQLRPRQCVFSRFLLFPCVPNINFVNTIWKSAGRTEAYIRRGSCLPLKFGKIFFGQISHKIRAFC